MRCRVAEIVRLVLLVVAGVSVCLARSADGVEIDRRIAETLDHIGRRRLSAEHHTPWQVFHGIKGMGPEFRVYRADGQPVNAIEFLCTEARVSGQRIFYPTPLGLEGVYGPAVEGHPDQILAVFAQSGVPLSEPIRVDGREYTVAHVLSQAKADYRPGQEGAWSLIAIATYEPADTAWVNSAGQRLGLDDLVASEVAAQTFGAACGGSHNLYSLAYALRRRREAGGAVGGPWLAAEQKLDRYVGIVQSLQNADGSFSTNYYSQPGYSANSDTVLSTTGHTLEWILLDRPDEAIREAWIQRAAVALLDAYDRVRSQPVECGALYHAARALRMYRERSERLGDARLPRAGSRR